MKLLLLYLKDGAFFFFKFNPQVLSLMVGRWGKAKKKRRIKYEKRKTEMGKER